MQAEKRQSGHQARDEQPSFLDILDQVFMMNLRRRIEWIPIQDLSCRFLLLLKHQHQRLLLRQPQPHLQKAKDDCDWQTHLDSVVEPAAGKCNDFVQEARRLKATDFLL